MPECSICKCDMGAEVFDAAAEEGSCNGDCFRLACKHAFHASCLVQSLRAAGSGCPVCRDGAEPRGPSRIIFEMQLDDEDDEDDEADAFVDRVVQALNTSNQRVMDAKRALNHAVKAYNVFRDKLRQERKRTVQIAMREFRARRYREFLAVRQRTEAALNVYHDQLRAEMGVQAGDLQFATADEFLRQPLHSGSSVRHQDPMRLSFWH